MLKKKVLGHVSMGTNRINSSSGKIGESCFMNWVVLEWNILNRYVVDQTRLKRQR